MQLLKNCKIFCVILLNNPLHDAWHQPNGRLKCAVIIIITADWMSPQIWRCAWENHSLESQESETRETRKRRHSNSLDAKFEIINTNWNTLGKTRLAEKHIQSQYEGQVMCRHRMEGTLMDYKVSWDANYIWPKLFSMSSLLSMQLTDRISEIP